MNISVLTNQDGVESMNNSALREFSAKCVAEYLKWSIKQTSVKVGGR